MPGEPYGGRDPDGFLARDTFVGLLEGYARHHRLPLRTASIRWRNLSA